MSDYVEIQRDVNLSCKLPENLDIPIWRYMDEEKFSWLLQNKELYLCRGDLLEERFEGSYSRQQIVDINEYLKRIRCEDNIKQERESRIQDRKKTYISCWCVGECDYDLMWKAYIKKKSGIAIKSSVRRLQAICEENNGHWPLDISLVNYFDHAGGEFVNYLGRPDIFLSKDKHFELDNELRVIHWPNISLPSPEYIGLPLNELSSFIEQVILQPGSSIDTLMSVKNLLIEAGLEKTPVYYSRDDRELLP